MHWVLQDEEFSEIGWDSLIKTLERFNFPHSFHTVVPATGNLIPEPQFDHQNVICMGSYAMRHAAKHYGWLPGVFDLFHQDFEQQKLHWGEQMLNGNSIVSSIQEATFNNSLMFVRPTQDSKFFSGRLFTREQFLKWQQSICDRSLPTTTRLTPETLIQMAKPIQIFSEYRFWIVKGKIVTQSLYKRGNSVVYSSEVDDRFLSYVRDRLEEWLPLETFVMDICDTENGIKIVEINTLNSAGFYAANVQQLVLTLDAAYNQSARHQVF